MNDDDGLGRAFLLCALLGAVAAIVYYGFIRPAHAIPKKDQCISVNALLNRNCAPVYMCNGTPETNADWCCSTTRRWVTEEQRLQRWYKRNCEK